MQKYFKVFLFLLIVFTDIPAKEYSWSATASKQEAFVNEAIHLKFVCTFTDRAELYTIEFKPEMENDFYRLELLTQSTSVKNGKKISTYEYVAFVKKAMLMAFDFEASMKKTNKDSIENTVLGRDNIDYEEFRLTKVKQELLEVTVKDTNTALVGDFSLNVTSDTEKVQAYEPFHLEIKISGEGNLNVLEAIDFDIENVKVFAQKPMQDVVFTKEGYQGSWTQKLAFVGMESFTIPSKRIEYFDIASQKVRVMQMQAIDVNVEKIYKKEELLDDVEKKEPFSFDFIYYVLTFIAGFLIAKINIKREKKDTKNEIFIQKVKAATSLEALSMLLILENQRKFSTVLLEIDTSKSISLSDAKNKVLRLL